jgi:hypothetical protein
MSLDSGFDAPFFTGTAATTLVPYKFDVAVAGRGYMLDREYLSQTPMISSIRATRTQGDGSNEPGEQSLNPEDLWRRSQQSWHFGAGQTYLDREDSNRRRFRSSKGINPWVEGKLSLLNGTTQSLAATGTVLPMVVAGSRLYAADGATLKYTTDLSSWSTVTGTSGVTISSLASDGYTVWIADGADVYSTNAGSTSAASLSTKDADILGYVKGRLMIGADNVLTFMSNITSGAHTDLWTHPSTNWAWKGFAESPGYIIAGGSTDSKSILYKITITAEGTALSAPSVAGELPDGETLFSVGSYLGFVFLGTSKGARFCTVDGNGNLTIGSLIPTPYPVRCFEGQDEFVWFGWSNYDGVSTGLGRMSLRTFADTGALLPAYASDLMVTSTANVLSVKTFNGKRVFTVSGAGVYVEDTANLVASGTVNCGRFNFGITESKIPSFVDVTFASGFAGSVQTAIAVNGSSTFTAVGTQTTSSANQTTTTFETNANAVEQAEVQFVLSRGTTTTQGPVVERYTVRAQPVPQLRRRIVLPLLLSDRVQTRARSTVTYDTGEELGVIEGWRSTKQAVTVQIGHESYASTVEDFDFVATHPTNGASQFWHGTCIVQFKTL